MSMLCDMMLRAGLLSEGQVDSARSHAKTHDVSMVDAVLALGLADEDTIVAFSSSKLMIPRIREAILDRAGPHAIGKLPSQLAWSYGLLPVSTDRTGNLTVAMADPTDIGAVNAIADYTGAYLVRAVAPAGPLRKAIERHYGPRPTDAIRPPDVPPRPLPVAPVAMSMDLSDLPPVPESPALIDPSSQETLLGMPSADTMMVHELHPMPDPAPLGRQAPVPDPQDLQDTQDVHEVHDDEIEEIPDTQVVDLDDLHLRRAKPSPGRVPEGVLPSPDAALPLHRERSKTPASWNPPLTDHDAEPTPLSPEAFAQVLPRLVMATDRDEVTRLLLDFLGAGFRRVILFVHSRGELRGHDARGPDLNVESVREVRIPSEQDSLFSRVIAKGTPYFGRMPKETPIDQAFAAAFGGLSGNVLILPVSLANRVPLVLFAHGTSTPVDPRSINALGEGVSGTLTRIITATKARLTPPQGLPRFED